MWFHRDGRAPAPLSVIAVASCFACVTPAVARTLHIRADRSGDKATIQAAIDAAAAGDTVLVAPGRYGESLTIHAADIVLRSEGGPEVTTLDGGQRPLSVVYFSGGETRACVLEGFTITGGARGEVCRV